MNVNYTTQFYTIQNQPVERDEISPCKGIKNKQNQNESTNLNQCEICGLINFNSWALTMHMRRHNNDRPSKCSYCPASFVNNTELKSHMTKHTKEKRHKCRFCEETFSSSSSRYFHEDKHGILQHKCKYCDIKFKTKVQRRNHQKTHGKGELTCNYCPKKFVNADYLKVHEENDHGRMIKALKCFKCKLDFNSKEDLAAHRSLHKSMTPGNRRVALNPKSNEVSYFQDSDVKLSSYFFTCGVCSEKFSFHIDLTKHIEKNHPTEKDKIYRFKCDICNKSFDSQVKLRGHKIGHGPKKHNCKECDYKTARAKDLERHIEARHSSDKAYKCSECNEAFTQYYNFVNHKLKHGEKKFKCNLCNKAYYVKSRLSKHIRSVHNSERQVCDQCGRVYSNMLSLKVHKNYMHKTPPLCLCNNCGNSILITELHSHKENCIKNSISIINQNLKGPLCTECNVTFSVPRYLLEHCKEFHPENIYPCPACQNEYLNQESAEKHYARVHENKIIQKHSSVITIEEKRMLRSVNSNYSLYADDFYECFACGKSFLFENDLEIHLSLPSCIKRMPYSDIKDSFLAVNIFNISKIHDNGYQAAETNNFEVKVLPKAIFSHPLGINKVAIPGVKKKRQSNLKITKPIRITEIKTINESQFKKENIHDGISINTDEISFAGNENTEHLTIEINSNIEHNTKESKSDSNSSIISSKNLMDILQGKIVNLYGQSFLPLNEVMDHLKQISGISLDP